MTDIILKDSPEAAHYVTGLSGWVSNSGHFYGNDEKLARWAGCTHLKCKRCDALVRKNGMLICNVCREKNDIERHAKREVEKWDGKCMLYADAIDKWFGDLDDLEEYVEEESVTLAELRVLTSLPIYGCELGSEYFTDELPDDGDLPPKCQEAIDVFNDILSECGPLSWTPSKKALEL